MRARSNSRNLSVRNVNQTFRDKKTLCHVTERRPHLREHGMQCDNNKDSSRRGKDNALAEANGQSIAGRSIALLTLANLRIRIKQA